MYKKIGFSLGVITSCCVPFVARAHEVYVLSGQEFETDKNLPLNLFEVFKNKTDVFSIVVIFLLIISAISIVFVLQQKKVGDRMARFFEHFKPFGPIAIRAAIVASLIIGAQSGHFLGPEISIAGLPYASILKILNITAGILIALGFFSELGAVLMLVVFMFISFHRGEFMGEYMLTYTNYVGELIAILLFGIREYSLDAFFRTKALLSKYAQFEVPIIRIFFGFALLYTAITVKLLHSYLTYDVVVKYNLTQFHWLFPHDPLLVVFGAAITEITMAIFIMLGFQLRFTLSIFLFYLTLSLLFFGEVVWPHFILYGIAIYLLVSPNVYSLDGWLHTKFKKSTTF